MNNLAIIPARGGSKRIPRKNIKNFLGKPILAYSIEIAIRSGLFSEVIVSTDDSEIADIAYKYGAKVPFIRNAKTSDDHAPLADVVDEVRDFYINNKYTFDCICCILPTAPFITKDNLIKGYVMLNQSKADYVRPLIRFSYPIQRALKIQDDRSVLFYPEYINTRTQDLKPAFHDSGQFYWMKFDNGLKGANLYGFEIPESHAQDIDNEEDWKLAELKYQLINNSKCIE